MIEKEFNDICLFKQRNRIVKGDPLRTNSDIVKPVFASLESLKEKLKNKFEHYKGIELTFEYSRGAANFPNILHTSILPPGQKVSDGIYVVICFDSLGRGALVGCAKSATNPQKLDVVIRKTTNKDILAIDVDGHNKNTHYNNTYANPKEFYYELLDDAELLNHITKSLDLVLYKLNLIDGGNLDVNQFVISQNLTQDFDPNNILEGRKKVAREINARQGQATFRKKLLEAYGAKCAISGCSIQSILDAAHIIPYKGIETNHVQNGIILRTDLHTLFDLRLIKIDPLNYTIIIDESLYDSEYQKLQGQKIFLPKQEKNCPSKESLKYHFNNSSI